jgi:hypothetical protein
VIGKNLLKMSIGAYDLKRLHKIETQREEKRSQKGEYIFRGR